MLTTVGIGSDDLFPVESRICQGTNWRPKWAAKKFGSQSVARSTYAGPALMDVREKLRESLCTLTTCTLTTLSLNDRHNEINLYSILS